MNKQGGGAAVSQPFEIITDPDVERRRAERAEEYGTWECGPRHIEFDGARAFNEGEPVPKSTVERLSLDKMGAVVAAGTFAKKQADEAAERAKTSDANLAAQIEAQTGAPNDAEATSKPTTKKGVSN